jgi:tight adherence protein B
LIPGLVVGYMLPNFYVRRQQRKRQRAFEAQLGDTISLLSNGVKAGYSVQQALASVAESGRAPLSDEIARVVREASLGLTLETALGHVNDRVQSKSFDLMVTAILIHRTVGGNLAEVLDKINETIRERVKVQGEVKVLTAQARASGYIITALPFAVGAILSLISPSFEKPLFTTPLGWGMIIFGLIMISIGYAIIRKITDIHL